jgi:uncharacterized membrane protein YjgN (DUF898 family)
MWWKIAGVWLIPVLLVAGLFIPASIETHAVKLDMPASMSTAEAQRNADIVVGMAAVIGTLVVLSIFAVPAWISWRIFRRHRKMD